MSGIEYVWHNPEERNEPNRAGSIHLPLDVVSRLGLDAMEAYKAVPKRGLEIGGLLLGRYDAGAIRVRDFQPVQSEHRWGPSYRLSETDLSAFEEALKEHSDTVGIYRTSTLAQASSLEQDAVNFFRDHFTGPGNVYLLIRPATKKATFFLPEGDTLTQVHEFPFRAAELPTEEEEPDRAVAAAAAAVPARVPAVAVRSIAEVPVTGPPVAVSAAPAVPRSRRGWWIQVWIQVAALIVGMVAGAAIYRGFQTAPRPMRAPVVQSAAAVSPVPPLSPPATATTEPASEPDTTLHIPLSAEHDGQSILVYWDRKSPAFDKATKAILYITDGDRKNQLNLDRDDLKAGEVSYRPRSSEVTFHLQVIGRGFASDDSIRVVGSPPVQRADSTPPVPTNQQGTATRSDTRADVDEYHAPSPFTPVPKPVLATSVPPAAPHLPTRSPEPEVPVTVEPAGQSAVGKVIGHIPLLRRLKKQPQPIVPPVPIHEVHPTITAKERHALRRSVPVDVRVLVAETGKVRNVELIGNGWRQPDPQLARRAMAAARRWEFTPAHSGPDRVPGEVILHFMFPTEEPVGQALSPAR